MNLHQRLRRSVSVVGAICCLAAWSSACGDSTTQPLSITGNYTATVFRATPSGGSIIDVLAQGGSLSISIASDNSTSGTLFLPASVAGSAVTVSMAGTAVQSGTSVHFEQPVDTFVRDLSFTTSGTSLQVINQVAGAAAFSITLTRQ